MAEGVLSILILVLLKSVGVNTFGLLVDIVRNIGTVLAIYGIFIALSCGLVVIMFSENHDGFTRWLIKNNAETLYRNAAIYSLGSFVFGMLLLCTIKIFKCQHIVSDLALTVFILNIIQAFTMIILVNNYLSVKRKWQDLH